MEWAILESTVPSNTLPISPIYEARGVVCDAGMCMFNNCSCLSLETTEYIYIYIYIYMPLSFAAFAACVVVKIFCKVKISGEMKRL